MSNLKSSLTRKLGPLPAWAWALIAFVGIYYYRTRMSAQASGTGTGSIAQSGPAPGTGEQVLQPGESIYDPTAGKLTTAPGGGGTDTTGTQTSAADLAASMDSLANALANGIPPVQVDINQPSQSGGTDTATGNAGTSGTKKGKSHKSSNKNRGHGKSKGQHNAAGKTSKHTPKGATTRARSGAASRPHTGGRTTGRLGKRPGSPGQKATGGSHRSAGTALLGPTGGKTSIRARQPTRTAPVRAVVRQRPVATHPAPAPSRQTGGVAPRPSAPPPRTQRAPSRPAPRPPRKRK